MKATRKPGFPLQFSGIIFFSSFLVVISGHLEAQTISPVSSNGCAGADISYKLSDAPPGMVMLGVDWKIEPPTAGLPNGPASNTNPIGITWFQSGTLIAHYALRDGQGSIREFETEALFSINQIGTISAPEQVCSGGSGTLTYQGSGSVTWLRCTSGCSETSETGWTVNPTGNTFSNLTETTMFRAKGCGDQLSNIKTVRIIGIYGVQVNPGSSCDNLTGNITANIVGQIKRWERSYDNGATWLPIVSANDPNVYITVNPYPYLETNTTQFKLVVGGEGCSDIIWQGVVTRQGINAGAINKSDVTYSCSSFNGLVKVEGNSGSVKFWERSDNKGVSWYKVTGSDGMSSINISATDAIVKLQAAVQFTKPGTQSETCPIVYTAPVDLEPLGPVGGILTATSYSPSCTQATGTLELQQYKGDRLTWQYYPASGTDWIAHPSASGTQYNFSLTSGASFRIKVERPTSSCPEKYSSVFKVNVSSQGGTTSSTNAASCGTATGNIVLSGEVGSIQLWEYSTNGSAWSEIPGSAGKDPLPFTTSEPLNYYRALVKLDACAAKYSTPAAVTVHPNTQPGVVRFVGEEKDAETIGGVLTFYPAFELQKYAGDIQTWWKYENTSQVQLPATSSIIKPAVSQTTGYRATVKLGVCDALLSGQATFVVNKKSLGEQQLVLGRQVAEYEGYSYQVKTTGKIELKSGFTYVANSAQDFFVLLDDTYALPPSDQNFVQEETILQEGLTREEDIYFANAYQRASTYTYLDGLGRPRQQVQRRSNPQEKDVVQPITYDALGRIDKDYLPYVSEADDGQFKPGQESAQASFYILPPAKVAISDYPFAVKVYEPNPLNRIAQQGAAGTDWQPGIGHPVKHQYISNAGGEVMLWEVIKNAGTQLPVTSRFYAPGELNVHATANENGFTVREYTDKQGFVVLKRKQNNDGEWLDTYYIYNEFNLVQYIIQPEGIAQLNGQNPDQDFLNAWAFQYRYDERRRAVEKRAPGADWIYMVYDDRDRLVLSQDGNQRSKNQWSFTKYDAFNRPVVSGIYTYNNPGNPSAIITRDQIKGNVSRELFTESYNGTLAFYGYTNTVFPTQSLTVLSVTYYDNYTFVNDVLGSGFTYDRFALEGLDAAPLSDVRNLTTGQQVRVLGTDTWIKHVTWYDKHYRNIQTLSTNHVGGTDRISQRFDFAGKVRASSTKHTDAGAVTTRIAEEFDYDHGGRLLTHYHKINDGPKILLKQLQYNALGQVVERNLHRKGSGLFQQSIDYRYNIRGWLTHINNAELADDGGITNDEGDDWFGQEIRYNSPIVTNAAPQFNGNISEIVWRTTGETSQAYAYQYDPTDRLKQSRYMDLGDPSNNGRYNEFVNVYDRNGNIRALERYGRIAERVYGKIDNLLYHYQGNRLLSVSEQDVNKAAGFDDANTAGNDYSYDVAGNMKEDKNKNITIQYNLLNLPETVTKLSGGNLTYGYRADGTKLYQIANEGEGPKRTDYSGAFIYENGTVKSIQHDEGRILPKGSGWEYQYHLKDHLGNIRVTLTTEEKETAKSLATLETINAPGEYAKFLNYNEAIKVSHVLFDHTYDESPPANPALGTYATRLTGANTNAVYGLAQSISVMPGDVIKTEVYAKYVDTNPANISSTDFKNFLLSIATGGNAAPGTIIDGGVEGSLGATVFPYEGVLTRENDTGLGPKAYLNYLVFDRDFKYLYGGFKRVTADSRETGNDAEHDLLAHEITIAQAGYVYIYLSNENETPVQVYFDDFNVEHIKSQVIQTDDYYPFGLTFNSYQRENSVPDKYKFQGQEHIDDLGLGWDSFKWRNHQPDIGRFFNVDPLAEKYAYNSPYAFSENKVVAHVELEGLESVSFAIKAWKDDYGYRKFTNHYSNKGSTASMHVGVNLKTGDVYVQRSKNQLVKYNAKDITKTKTENGYLIKGSFEYTTRESGPYLNKMDFTIEVIPHISDEKIEVNTKVTSDNPTNQIVTTAEGDMGMEFITDAVPAKDDNFWERADKTESESNVMLKVRLYELKKLLSIQSIQINGGEEQKIEENTKTFNEKKTIKN